MPTTTTTTTTTTTVEQRLRGPDVCRVPEALSLQTLKASIGSVEELSSGASGSTYTVQHRRSAAL
eukprot:7414151-Heterocapsa_arctica.AAC.1